MKGFVFLSPEFPNKRLLENKYYSDDKSYFFHFEKTKSMGEMYSMKHSN